MANIFKFSPQAIFGFHVEDPIQYTNLITYPHLDKTNFVQTVDVTTKGFGIYYESPYGTLHKPLERLFELYDLDLGLGTQLDALADWIGVDRYFNISMGSIGKNFPNWSESHLSDDWYRKLLRWKIKNNHWDGTPNPYVDTTLLQDNDFHYVVNDLSSGDISIGLVSNGTLDTPSSQLLIFLVSGKIRFVAGGIHLSCIFYPLQRLISHTGQMFGLDTDNDYYKGLDYGYPTGELIP